MSKNSLEEKIEEFSDFLLKMEEMETQNIRQTRDLQIGAANRIALNVIQSIRKNFEEIING